MAFRWRRNERKYLQQQWWPHLFIGQLVQKQSSWILKRMNPLLKLYVNPPNPLKQKHQPRSLLVAVLECQNRENVELHLREQP